MWGSQPDLMKQGHLMVTEAILIRNLTSEGYCNRDCKAAEIKLVERIKL